MEAVEALNEIADVLRVIIRVLFVVVLIGVIRLWRK